MTLNTAVRVLRPIPVEPLARRLHDLVGGRGELVHDREPDWTGNPSWYVPPSVGNDALLHVSYGADGPMAEYPDDPESEPPPKPAYLEISFDTAYSYRRRGQSCSALHADYIARVASWLEGVPFAWQNEYTGVWATWGQPGHTDALSEFAGT